MDGDGPCSEIIHDVLFGRPKYRTCLNALRLSGVKPHRPSSIHGVVGGGNSGKIPGNLQSPINVRGIIVMRRYGTIIKILKAAQPRYSPCLWVRVRARVRI